MLRSIAPALVLSLLTITPATAQQPTLYQQLGGYDGVVAYVSLVFPRVVQQPELAHFFGGHGTDSQQRQFQMVVELVCQKSGGPCVYIGRPMPTVHTGLAITEANWSTFMRIISGGMDERRYPDEVKRRFLELWRGFHDSVVEPRAAKPGA